MSRLWHASDSDRFPLSGMWRRVVIVTALLTSAAFASAAWLPVAFQPQQQSPASRSAVRGRASALLPDGQILIVGGEIQGVVQDTIAILDPATDVTVDIGVRLIVPRAWHTATLLPDGRVVIAGGVDGDGDAERGAEILDLSTRRIDVAASPNLRARAHHSATVLSDGRVLFVGGRDETGQALNTAELWDPGTGTVEEVAGLLHAPHEDHAATLQADGTVRISGGGAADELYDPNSQTFSIGGPPSQAPGGYLAESTPIDGAIDVPQDTRIVLRFAVPLAVQTVTTTTITLRSQSHLIPVDVMPVEEGRLAFIRPRRSLDAGEAYVLLVDGAFDNGATRLAPAEIRFSTGSAASQSAATDADESWTPTDASLRGEWKIGRPDAPWRRLEPLQAPAGETALSGEVLLLNGRPLAGVTLSIGDIVSTSDRTGRFLLRHLPPGRHVLEIDGSSANRPPRRYGLFRVGVYVHGGRTTTLSYTIWMPRLDDRHAVTIASPSADETVVTTPYIPGLELHIPAGTVVRDRNRRVITSVSITPIPVDRPPFPLPAGVQVPIYFTIQPGGAYLRRHQPAGRAYARLIYPNYRNEKPGTRIDFWQYDADEKGWFVYGRGTVTADGRQVVPDAGVTLYEFTGAMVASPEILPVRGRQPGDWDNDGDPVDLSTGQFVLEKTDLVVPDVIPLSITRVYRPQDVVLRAFGIGGTLSYDMFLAGDISPYSFIVLALADGGHVRYERISGGTSFADAIYEHTATPSEFYKSRIVYNGVAWDLTLTNGTVFTFPDATGTRIPERAALIGIRDRNGNKLTIVRDSNGRIQRMLSPDGRVLDVTYDGAGRLTKVTDPIGRIVTYTYDATGHLWKVTDPEGGVTEYTYDAAGRMRTIKDARGVVFLTNEYDADGRVVRQTQADGGTFQFIYAVGPDGRISQTDVTNPRGVVHRTTFNADEYTVAETFAAGRPEQQTRTYERETRTNLILRMTDPLDRKTTYTYDPAGNVTSVTRLAGTPNAVTKTMTYGPFNQVASVTDPLNHATTLSHDVKGNVIAVSNALGHTMTATYNGAGQLTSSTDPLGHTTALTYNGPDVTSVTDPLNRTWMRWSDSVGREISATDPLGRTTRWGYDPLNSITLMTDAIGGQTSFTYDPNGRLLSLTDAKNQTTSYTWDTSDRVADRTDPLSRAETYGYDMSGNLTQVTDRKGQVTSYAYDGLDRVTRVTYADNSTTSYVYDAGNRLLTISDSLAGTITRTYDALDRLTSETTPEGSISYTYDADGQRTSMTVMGQPTVTYAYDEGHQLTTITQGTNVVSFAYDAAGRRTSVTLPNGIAGNYEYDGANQLTSLTYTRGVTTLGTLTYTYDALGNRTAVGGTWARTGLPPALASATYDAGNRIVTWGGTSFTYDLNGSLTSDGTTTYSWNARNQLVDLSGGATASFAYDGLGRRRGKTISGMSTNFLYDGVNLVQETDGTIPKATLLTGLNIDETFIRTETTGSLSLLPDILGSTMALADETGAVQTEYTFDPFGTAMVTGAPTANSFQFTGRENDATGAYYYRARYYSSTLQRFLTEDPIGFEGGDVNLYGYAFNKPMNFTDPLGLDVTVCWYVDAAGGFGHVGFGLPGEKTTYGFYPIEGGSGPGEIKADPQSVPLCKTIKTKPQQDECMLKCRMERASNPGDYSLTGRNCTDFVRECMKKCDVPRGWEPLGETIRPKPFFDGLPGRPRLGRPRQ